MSLRARPGPALSTSTVAAPVVQVATLVEDQVAPVAPACHPQDVACLHQGWTTDHPARPVVPMAIMGVPMEALMVALTVVLMVDHMAHMAPLAHMVLQGVHTVITVDLMVDLQALMALLVLVLTMALTRDPPGDHHPTVCQDLDPEEHPLHQGTCSAPCTPEVLVLPHLAMEVPHHVVHHLAWDHHQANMDPHLLEDLLLPWTPGHHHQGQTSSRDLLLMEDPHLMALLLMVEHLQPLMSTQHSSHPTMHPLQQLLPHPHTMPLHHPPISTGDLLGVIIALKDHHHSQKQSLKIS